MRTFTYAAMLILCIAGTVHAAEKTIKVFILAGDDNMLEQASIDGKNLKTKVGLPGTLVDVISKQKRFSFLRDNDNKWVTRNDVILYDAHPSHNNTVLPGSLLQVGDIAYGGQRKKNAIGPELMFGHVVGNAIDEPVLLIRSAVHHPISYKRGSRSLYHDFRSPSRGGGADQDRNWDVIHFNWGIWDTYMYKTPGKKGFDKNGTLRISPEKYEENLKILVAKMKKTGATLIWGSITPVTEDCPTTFEKDVVRYNEIAAEIMKENGVIINDLHAETLRQGYPKRPNAHSVGDLGPKVTEAVLAALKARKQTATSLPRVLVIGDSISTPYTRKIIKNLEGIARVVHNPGNGEDTVNGVKKIDMWLDLKTYNRNGQSYLELINGIKFALKNPKRVYPNYSGETLEVAGFAWFQGIIDSRSEVKAKEYEKNLVCLITDIRKDLNLPKLPVVIVASHNGRMKADRATPVHDAQMVIGNPSKYPEFKGTVISVDTTPFYRDKKLSPGIPRKRGYSMYTPESYNSNAESYLLIGEAMGNAMLKLMDKRK